MTLPILFLASIATLPYPSVTPSQLQSGDFDGKRVKMEATKSPFPRFHRDKARFWR